jgi:hypothetical protein
LGESRVRRLKGESVIDRLSSILGVSIDDSCLFFFAISGVLSAIIGSKWRDRGEEEVKGSCRNEAAGPAASSEEVGEVV